MRRPRPALLAIAGVVAVASIALACAWTARAQVVPKHRAVVVGELTVNPTDVVAVYRPVEGQGVAVLVGRPGQDVQLILFREPREAATVFNDLWNNTEVVKYAGDDDARPLTRMALNKPDRQPASLIVNLDRLLAIRHDADTRSVHIYLDRPRNTEPLIDPNSGAEHEYLDLPNSNGEADVVTAAYRACVLAK